MRRTRLRPRRARASVCAPIRVGFECCRKRTRSSRGPSRGPHRASAMGGPAAREPGTHEHDRRCLAVDTRDLWSWVPGSRPVGRAPERWGGDIMTAPLLIAQISDLHIKRPGERAYEEVDTAAALERSIEHLNRFRPRPDFVVISGDIVDRGLEEEYAHARSLLKVLALPSAAIPGNHDERQNFRRAFSEQPFAQPSGPGNLRIEVGGLVLLLLDSSVPGKDYGELDAQTLHWLTSQLTAAAHRPTLLFLHHPPFATGIAHMDRQNLRNATHLAAVVQRHPQVRLIAAGHVHRAVTTLFAGISASI